MDELFVFGGGFTGLDFLQNIIKACQSEMVLSLNALSMCI